MNKGTPTHLAAQARLSSFSLVELLVAIAVLSIIVILLLSMTSSITSIWQAGQAHNERRATTDAVFEHMQRDLQQAAIPASHPGNPQFINTNSLEMVINPTGIAANYELPQAIFWQAPIATDGSINGSLAIIGYFIQWVNGAPCLTRLLINPSSTGSYEIYSNPSSWITSSLITSTAPATAASNYAGLLAPNVLGLWVQVLDANGNPIQQVGATAPGESFDSRLPYAYTNYAYTNSGGTPALATNVACGLPAAVQIGIVVIDSRTALHLAGTEKPSATSLTGNFWSDIQTFYQGLPTFIQKGAEIQTTTVNIPVAPR